MRPDRLLIPCLLLLLACGEKDADDADDGDTTDDTGVDVGGDGGGDDGGGDDGGDDGGGDDGGDTGGDDGGGDDGGDDGGGGHPLAGEYQRPGGAVVYVSEFDLTDTCSGDGVVVIQDDGSVQVYIPCVGFDLLSNSVDIVGEGGMVGEAQAAGVLSVAGIVADAPWTATFDTTSEPMGIQLESSFSGSYSGFLYSAQVRLGDGR